MGHRHSAAVALAFMSALACGHAREPESVSLDTSSAAGDVSPDSALVGTVFHGVKYPLTSENYRKWMVAQAALDSLPEPADMPRIELRDPTDDDIERTVDFLSNRDKERHAIERAGLSVKDFVLTNVALGQAFNFGGDDLVPKANRVFVQTNRLELTRTRQARRFHILDDDDDAPGGQGGGGPGNGHKHRHGKHKHQHKG
jgi:hypothetical protein